MLSTVGLQAQSTQWTGAIDNDWTKAGNWDNGVPNSTTDSFITNGGTAVIGSGGLLQSDALNVGANGLSDGTLWITSGTLQTGVVVVGSGVSTGAIRLTGTGAVLIVPLHNFELGGSSTGSLLIESGARVVQDEFGSNFRVGGGPTGSGSASVQGNGSLLIVDDANPQFGRFGVGSLAVGDGGLAQFTGTSGLSLGVEIGSSGTITLNGTGSGRGAVEAVFIAEEAGAGTIVFDGGILRTRASQSDFLQNFEAGDVTINSGGAFIDSNGFNIGISTVLGGNGTLTKQGNGTLTLTGNNSYSGGTIVRGGTLAVNDGGTITHAGGNLTVGQSSGDSATFELGANGSLSAFRGTFGYDGDSFGALGISGGNATFADELYIGYTGNGSLNLSGNGTLSNTKAFIGVNSPSVSTANVTGGVWTNSGELTVGYGGRGSLAISGNGTVTSAGAFFGYLAASNGNNATITGPGASWTSTKTFYLGTNGSDNSVLVTGGGSLLSGNSDFLIGANAGSGNNSLTTSGNGSTFTNNATLYVGRSGVGNSLAIENGADVTSRNVRIGGGTGSNGTTSDNFVTINGTGSTWTVGGSLRVGSNGDNSTLTISNGAVMSVTGNSFLGYDAVSDGNAVSLSGNGSKWTVNALAIGRLGTNNTVTVSEGGNLTATGVVIAEQGGSSGTLRIGTGGAAGSVSAGQITGGNGTAGVVFNHTDINLNFNSVLAGSLSVQHIGSGATTFNATNTYTGGTTITAGTLRTTNSSALGSGAVTLDAGTLDPAGVLSISSLTWNGGTIGSDLGTSTDLVSLTGNLTLGGGGTFAFTAGTGFAPNINYTILSAANLSDPILAQFTGNQLLGLDPVFSRSGLDLLVTFAGTSTGPLLQNVGGAWTPVTANFVVNGPARTGTPADNNTVNSLIFHPNSSLLIFNNLTVTSGNLNVTGGISHLTGGNVITPGDFNKLGGGTLIAGSNFRVGGAANIQGGALFLNGQIVAPGGLSVFQNALLGGSGLLIGNLFNGGNLAPGNSPGTLTVAGNFVQSSSGTLEIELASLSVFDRLIVSGNASLAGTLQVASFGGFNPEYGQQFAFLQAGSISGQFDNITTWDPSRFRARFLVNGGTGTILIAPASYTLVAETPNQKNVAKALNNFINAKSGDKQTVSIALDLQSESQYPAAFDAISPAFYESLADITIEQTNARAQMLAQRASAVRLGARGFQAIGIEAPLKYDKDGRSVFDAKDGKNILSPADDNNWGVWMQGNGIFARVPGIGGVSSFNFQNGGFLAGVDYLWSENLVTGVYGGYQGTYAKYGNGGVTTINAVDFGLYAGYQSGGFYADAIIGGGSSSYSVRRPINFSTVDRTATSRPNGGQFTSYLGLGYDWNVGNFTFGPILTGQYTYAGIAPFTENGAGALDLAVGQQNAGSLRTSLGGRVAYAWKLSGSIALIPEARLFWQHEFLENPRNVSSSLDGGGGPSFDYTTSAPARDAVFAGAGLSAQFGERWTASFYYNADFGRQDYISHAISTGLNFKF